LPHASVTVQLFVAVKLQPVPGTSAAIVPEATNPVEQLSVTDAAPKAALICVCVGLHTTAVADPNVITGACISLVKVTVCDAVPILPHASVTVHVLITEREQPDPVSAPTFPVAVNPVLQLSITLATVPNAFAISVVVGLHNTVVAGFSVITGTCVSLVKVIVWFAVPILPHASTALHVLTIVLVQPGAPVSGASVNVAVNPVEQLSETVGIVTAAFICVCVGLHIIEPIAPSEKVGGVKSRILVIAGEGQPVVLAVPAGMLPQLAVVTYLVLILYPAQFSAVGGVFAPQLTPSSKLYSILNPATVGGGVTTIVPQPVFTVGADTAGKTINSLLPIH